MKKFLSLDLELNNAQDGSTPNPKIIQVGIAIGSSSDNIIKKKWYLDPQEPIFPFITDLTGITDDDIKTHAVSHKQCAKELSNLILEHDTFVNPVTWGGGDSTELKQEFLDRGIIFPHFGRRWIDVKTWHTLNMISNGKNTSGGLRSSMSWYKLTFQGVPHRADDDAHNTLRLFFEIVNRQKTMLTMINTAKGIK
jgi:inhibitor of KinA sporulation pathway (predicted exonuclease)